MAPATAATATAAAKNGAVKTAAGAAEVEQIDVQRIQAKRIIVPIVGTAPLIMHKWSEKAKRQMLDAMQGKRKVKDVRDPEADYQSSMYRIAPGNAESEYGFPVLGFKAAIVSAGRFFGKDLPMTAIRQFVFMTGATSDDGATLLVPLLNSEPHMREDTVRLSQSSTDLRYRAEFAGWRAELDITYVESKISQGTVLALVDAAGMGVGVGEWRPEKSGMNGTFTLDPDRDVTVVR